MSAKLHLYSLICQKMDGLIAASVQHSYFCSFFVPPLFFLCRKFDTMALSSSPCCFSPRHLLLPSSLTVLPRSLPSSLSLSLCSSSRYFVENNILSSDAKEHPGAIVNDTLLVRSNHITLVTLYEDRDNAAPCQLNSVCCDFEAGSPQLLYVLNSGNVCPA